MRMLASVVGALAALIVLVVAAQTPPMRIFGTVTVDGRAAPAGTVVEAYVNGTLCGEGQVRRVSDEIPLGFVVDVRSAGQTPGCGIDGDSVTLKVGGVQAAESAEYATGTFLRLNLTVSGQAATPPPGPTPPPFTAQTPAPTAAATATPAPGSPTAAASPGASPTATATGTAAASPTATGSPSATPSPGASPARTASPPVFTTTPAPAGSGDGNGGGSGAAIAAVVAVVLLAGAGAGGYLFYRRRAGG